MCVWKNIKCPKCGKPNDRAELSQREGHCFYCGFTMVGNLNGFVNTH